MFHGHIGVLDNINVSMNTVCAALWTDIPIVVWDNINVPKNTVCAALWAAYYLFSCATFDRTTSRDPWASLTIVWPKGLHRSTKNKSTGRKNCSYIASKHRIFMETLDNTCLLCGLLVVWHKANTT